MTDRKRNLLVGVFVLAGMMCLAALIILFGESRGLFRHTYIVRSQFDRIADVREGTDVTLAGVWVGNVQKVELADTARPGMGTFVFLDIDSRYSIPRGSVAAVVRPIMGQTTINIAPPPTTNPPVPTNGTAIISGELKSPLDSVIDPKMLATLEKTTAQIGILAEALTPAAKAIDELLRKRTVQEVDESANRPEKTVANLYTAVQRLDIVLKHIDMVVGDPEVQSDLKQTLANFKAASEEVNKAVASLKNFGQEATRTAERAGQTLDKVDATVDTTQRYIEQLGQKLLLNADHLARVLQYFVQAGQDVAEGEGTVGMLLRDPKFYDELMLTTRRLGAAAAELEVLVKQWQKRGLLGGS